MTEPVDPQERYLERLRAVWNDDFGTTYRPGLADTFASSDASMADIARIGSMVRALDTQMATRLQKQSGAIQGSTGEQTDLLTAVGAGHEAVKPARYHAEASAHADTPWWQDVYRWVGKHVYGVDLTDPNLEDESVRNAVTNPGSHLLMGGLEQLGKFAGAAYRSADPQGAVKPLGGLDMLFGGDAVNEKALPELGQKSSTMKAMGYDPADIWDQVAFNWNQGEATFRNQEPVRAKYGDADVDLALEVFRHGWQSEDSLYATRTDIENQFAAGDITADEAQQKIQRLEDPEFVAGAYEAMNRLHVSPGRDLARALLPDSWQDDKQFSAVSGSVDALWSVFADPTIIGGKAYHTAQVAKWGLESLNDSKIYHLLGEVDELGQAPAARYLGNNARRAGVENFVNSGAKYRDALAAGDQDAADVIMAGVRERHRELLPLWSEINGVRPAITEAERKGAETSGIHYVDANGIELPGIRTAPITDVRGFAEHAVNNFAFQRLTNGMAAQTRPLLPGKIGAAAEKRAILAEKRTRGGIDKARDEGATVINFADAKLSGIVPDEAAEKLQEAAKLRGQELFDQADAAELSARKVQQKWDAASRRLTTFLPATRELNINSASDSQFVERFARIFLPKWEATRYASMWESASPAGRRTLAKAMLIQTLEASGLTSSPLGRELVDKYVNDLDKLGRRRYGFGNSDLISEEYRGDLRAGLYESQIQTTVAIPSFSELRQVAAKIAAMSYDPNMSEFGLNAATARALAMGKGRKIPRLGTTALRYWMYQSPTANSLLHFVKMGWILTPANMVRNAGDEGLLTYLSGNGGRLNRGRELLQRADMRADFNPELPRHRVLQAMVPRSARPAVKTVGDAVHAISVGRLRTTRLAGGRPVTDQDVEFLKELEDGGLPVDVLEALGGRHIDSADEALGHEYAVEAAQAGVPVQRWKLQGYKLDAVDADSGSGLTALANGYGQRFMPGSPANATLAWMMWHEAVDHPEFLDGLTVDAVEAMQKALPVDDASFFSLIHRVDPNYVHAQGLSDEELAAFSGDAAIVPPSAAALSKHLVDDPRYNRLAEELELYNIDAEGKKLLPDDVAGRREARARMAQRYLEDVKLAVTGSNGKIDPELASALVRNDLPDEEMLRALGADRLPPHAIKAQYGVADEGKVVGLLDKPTALMTRAYDTVVTKPMRALVRAPLYADMYVTARGQTKKMADELVEKHGWSREAADDLAVRNAQKAALNEMLKFVDNPKVASQFSQMSNNWWSFLRAQEDWLRRYGRAIKADPVIIQKAHLAIMGAEDAGILDRDADGNLILTYPGSGAVIEGLLHVGAFIGWGNPALIPSVPDLQTRLTFTNPSLNNPFGYSTTPLVSIPWRLIATIAPGGELLHQVVDERLNGELGAGRSWWEQLLPGPITRAAQLYSGDWNNTGSQVGGATATALTYLAMNGQLEKYSDTPEDRTRAIRDVRQQARNILGLRALGALFAPGAPGMPQIGDDENLKADPSYLQAGMGTLKAEFDNMVRRMGVGPAYELWARLHPEASVFMDARRTKSAPGAYTPSTMDAAGYIMENKDFFTGKYKAVAPYFIPEAPGEFSPIAWRTMTELGVREYRDLDSMFIDLVNANGTDRYFREKDKSDAAIADARKAGNADRVKQLQQQWKDTKAALNVEYPALDDYFTQGLQRKQTRLDAVDRLQELVEDPNAPADVLAQLKGATDMVQVFREYEARNAALGTARSNQAQAERDNLKVAYHDAMRNVIKQYPSLNDAYNGIFRSLVEEE